jgi:hypothetical protein
MPIIPNKLEQYLEGFADQTFLLTAPNRTAARMSDLCICNTR